MDGKVGVDEIALRRLAEVAYEEDQLLERQRGGER